MLTAEERMELGVLRKHGAGIRELARVTGWSRNTVRRYLRAGDAAAVRKAAPKRAEKLDPFKAYIIDRVKAAAPDRIPAVVLFHEIKTRGYDGGETRLKQFVRGLVLGWSRAAYVEFCDDERVETLIRAHENALLAFGGVPIEVLYDSMRTVVIERNTYGRGVHRFHPGFLDYARHAGFLPRLCQPYRAQTKGKVERFIGYLKRSFWVPFVASMRQAGLKPDKHAANAAVARWLREVAGTGRADAFGRSCIRPVLSAHGALPSLNQVIGRRKPALVFPRTLALLPYDPRCGRFRLGGGPPDREAGRANRFLQR